MAITAAFVVITGLWLRAEANRVRAEDNAARAEGNFRLAHETVEEYYVKVSQDRRLREQDLETLRRDLLQRAAVFYQKFIEERGDDPGMQAELGRAYNSLAKLADAVDDKPKAITFAEQALAIWENLVSAQPTVSEYPQSQAQTLQHLAVLYRFAGRSPELVENTHRQAIGIQEHLIQNHGDVPQFRHDLATSYNSLGNLYRRLEGRSDDAETAYKRAIEMRKELVRDHEKVPEYRVGLGMTYNGLGVLYRASGRRAEAAEAYKNAREVQEQLVRGNNPPADDLSELARTCLNLGNLYEEEVLVVQSRWAEAETALKQTRDITEKLVRIQPNVTDYWSLLGGSHNSLGVLYLDIGLLPEAEAALGEALKVRSRLAGDKRASASYQSELATTLNALGCVYRLSGRSKQAESNFGRAITIYDRLIAKQPKFIEFTSRRAMNQINLGYVASDTGRHQDALDSYSQAILILKPLHQKSKRSYTRQFLCLAYEGRAEALTRLGKPDEAMAEWEQALPLAEKQNRDALRSGRAVTLAHLGQTERALKEVQGLKGTPADPEDGTLYQSACVYSLASAAVRNDPRRPRLERDQSAESYAARAVALLEQTRTTAFFKVPINMERLKKDKDLDPIRSRDDFKKLLREVEAKAKPAAN
jgi:tetratricopeptide (TPR) repeat protein